jgi:CubicO group peptidase (beta-lactamase class C family)
VKDLSISRSNLDFGKLILHLQKTQEGMDSTASSLIILQNGEVLSEWYSGFHSHQKGSAKVCNTSQFNVASVRKTYIAFALAFAIHRGRINSIDDKVTMYLTEYKYEDLEDITIRHLLTHTHGLVEQDDTFVKLFKEGSDWKYTNTGVNLLIKIVERTTGRKISEILRDEVFKPLSLIETGWRTEKAKDLIYNVYEESDILGPYDSSGGEQSNLFTSTRELAFWGNLFLNKGKVNGLQLLSEELFEQMTTIQSPVNLPQNLPRQGFFWWVQDENNSFTNEIGERAPKGSYQAMGLTGCACLVLPKYNVVAVRMFNQTTENQQPDFIYLTEIKEFGNLVSDYFSD